MTSSATPWLLLVTNLPGHNPTLRMRAWRAMKAVGAELLRDGAYLLPNLKACRKVLEIQAVEIRAAGGAAHLLSFAAETAAQNAEFTALFDRTEEYAGSLQRLDAFRRVLPLLQEPEIRQRITGLRREAAATVARDFFPGEARKQVESALEDAEAAINRRFAPDEPVARHQGVRLRDPDEYQGRLWATRECLWIDRVASAWLIRRFIDPQAGFLWLKRAKDCPKTAVGFDFDGAEFSHVDSKVTFEVLLASFALEGDVALVRLGALVHHLDIGGIPTAEGPGFSAIMAGARSLHSGDDALLASMVAVLDSLYAGFLHGA